MKVGTSALTGCLRALLKGTNMYSLVKICGRCQLVSCLDNPIEETLGI